MTGRNGFDVGFIVGMPRSGTTMIQAILNKSPQLVTGPETHFMEALTELRFPETGLTSEQTNQLRAHVLNKWGLSIPPAENVAGGLVSIKDLFREVLASFQVGSRGNGAGLVVEKTPNHLFHIDTLFRWFPESRAVVTIRKLRGVAGSLWDTPWARHYTIGRMARLWADHLRVTQELLHRYPDRMLIVDYGVVTRSPACSAERIFGHYGLDYRREFINSLNDSTEQFIGEAEEKWKRSSLIRETIQSSFDKPSGTVRGPALCLLAFPVAYLLYWKLLRISRRKLGASNATTPG